MIDATYGDKVTMLNGEVGVVTGFMGRGRNALVLRLKPAANGNKRAAVVRAKDIAAIERSQD